jgi:hypothetical protein
VSETSKTKLHKHGPPQSVAMDSLRNAAHGAFKKAAEAVLPPMTKSQFDEKRVRVSKRRTKSSLSPQQTRRDETPALTPPDPRTAPLSNTGPDPRRVCARGRLPRARVPDVGVVSQRVSQVVYSACARPRSPPPAAYADSPPAPPHTHSTSQGVRRPPKSAPLPPAQQTVPRHARRPLLAPRRRPRARRRGRRRLCA